MLLVRLVSWILAYSCLEEVTKEKKEWELEQIRIQSEKELAEEQARLAKELEEERARAQAKREALEAEVKLFDDYHSNLVLDSTIG